MTLVGIELGIRPVCRVPFKGISGGGGCEVPCTVSWGRGALERGTRHGGGGTGRGGSAAESRRLCEPRVIWPRCLEGGGRWGNGKGWSVSVLAATLVSM